MDKCPSLQDHQGAFGITSPAARSILGEVDIDRNR